MTTTILRRLARRATAIGAGSALVAAGLSMGVMAPANAASVITGQLVDANGNPVEGVVDVYRQQPDGTFIDSGTEYLDNGTFSDGSYGPGVYKFRYSTWDGSFFEFFKDKGDLATADAVALADGATANLGTWTVEHPLVVGVVTDPSGRPVTNAEVRAVSAADASDLVAQDYTDGQGRFYLPVGGAPVKVHVRSTSFRFSSEWYNDKGSFAAADPVTGTATGASLAIALAPAGAITGQVTSDAGVPLEYVEVRVAGSRDITDKNGVYVLEGVDNGSHVLSFSDPLEEYLGEYYNNVPTADAATPVHVEPGQVVSAINANLTPAPAPVPAPSVELSGVVRDDAGTPLVGVPVTAWSTPNAGADKMDVETVRSNRAGVYSFTELDQVAGETQFKIEALSNVAPYYEPGDENGFQVFGGWYGGKTDYERAPVVTIPAAGADISLLRAGGVEGSIAGVTGLGFSGYAQFLDADGGAAGYVSTKADNTFKTRSLHPGTYRVLFSDGTGNHAGEWWKNATFEDATKITVKPGQMVSGLNAALAATLSTNDRPEIKGYPWIGKSISASSGSWNLSAGTTYTYEWLSGSTVVGTGASLKPSKSLMGKRLVVRVTAQNGKLAGTAWSAKSAKVGYKPKIKAKIKGAGVTFKIKAKPVKAKLIKGKIVAKEIVKVKNNGKIKFKKVAKTKINKGKGRLSLGKQKLGKHKVVFFFKGKGKVGSNDIKRKVKIKR